ncbi:hypothetical protein FB451DRAFT_1464029 [Mycena latifolia]|nr:hypothetical protein FB451DRAFT_1464029 [Mycena latifolia]
MEMTPSRAGNQLDSPPPCGVTTPKTLLALLRQVYDSPQLAPPPYEKKITPARFKQGMLEECMWQAVLLLGASGRAGRPPRMDFILMHFASNARAVVIILRTRPRVDPALAMSYPARPVPPGELGGGGESAYLPLLRNAALDRTLFIPVAGVLTGASGWVDHGEKQGSWDFSGIGWDEAWSE